MPSIDQNILSVKTSPKQETVKPKDDAEQQVSAKKPFQQHLKDEIKKEVDAVQEETLEQTVENESEIVVEKEQAVVAETAMDPFIELMTSEASGENNIPSSGNTLPIEEAVSVAVIETETRATSPVLVTEKALQGMVSKPIASTSLKLDATEAAESDLDPLAQEQLTDLDSFEEPVIKIQKQVVDGQINTKVEIPVNDTSKLLKTIQTTSVGLVSVPESPKNPIDTLSMQSQITTPVSNKQWGAELSQRVNVMLTNGQQVAELRLNPAHLGSVSIRLQLDEDQANISFVTQNQAVKEAVEASLHKLRDQLQQQGLDLGHVDIEKRDSEEASEHSVFAGNANSFNNENNENESSVNDMSTVVQVDRGLSIFV